MWQLIDISCCQTHSSKPAAAAACSMQQPNDGMDEQTDGRSTVS